MSKREISVFSLSLLDVLFCAFGGVIVLTVVFSAIVKYEANYEERRTLLVTAQLEFDPPRDVLDNYLKLVLGFNKNNVVVNTSANSDNKIKGTGITSMHYWQNPNNAISKHKNAISVLADLKLGSIDTLRFQVMKNTKHPLSANDIQILTTRNDNNQSVKLSILVYSNNNAIIPIQNITIPWQQVDEGTPQRIVLDASKPIIKVNKL